MLYLQESLKMTDVIKPLFKMFFKYIPDIIKKSEKLDENLKIRIPIEEQIVVFCFSPNLQMEI